MTFGVNNLPSRPYHGGRRVPRRSRRKVVTEFENLPAGREQQIPRPANPSGAQKARCARDDNVALEGGLKLRHHAAEMAVPRALWLSSIASLSRVFLRDLCGPPCSLW